MLRTLEEEQKTELPLALSSTEQVQFTHMVFLADHVHVVGLKINPRIYEKSENPFQPAKAFETQCLDNTTIHIWNSVTKKFIFSCTLPFSDISSMTLLSNGNPCVTEITGAIHELHINLDGNINHTEFDNIRTPTYSMTVLDNGCLVLGHEGLIHFRDKNESFKIGSGKITALDARPDGSIVIGNSAGTIYVFDRENLTSYEIGSNQINCLVVLPNNNIIIGKNTGLFCLNTDESPSSVTQISKTPVLDLCVSPDGFIGCLTKDALQFYKPSWIQQVKDSMPPVFPTELTNIISDYTYGVRLFNHPKQLREKECALTAPLSPKMG